MFNKKVIKYIACVVFVAYTSVLGGGTVSAGQMSYNTESPLLLACVYVQLIGSPLDRLPLVCWFTQLPVMFVAYVALMVCPVSASFTVPPTGS